MAITFDEILENDLINKDIINNIPRKCVCGSDIAFTDSLRQVYCTNDNCYLKMSLRIKALCNEIGVIVDDSVCEQLSKDLELESPYQIFLLDQVIDNGYNPSNIDKIKKFIKDLKDYNTKVEPWYAAKLIGIPDIKNVAYKIFYGYNCLDDAYEDIEEGKASFISEKLGIVNVESSVLAVNIYNQLIKYKDEILFGETQLNVYERDNDYIRIVIDGNINDYKNNSEFVEYLNNRYNSKVSILLTNNISDQIDILVSDRNMPTNKTKAATKINNDHIEQGIIKGEFTQEEIGKFKSSKDIHSIGEVILIIDSEALIDRLDGIYL